MKVLREDSEKILIEMTKIDFNSLRNIFVYNKDFCDEDLSKDEYEVAKRIVYLKHTEKGLFDEIDILLKAKKNEK